MPKSGFGNKRLCVNCKVTQIPPHRRYYCTEKCSWTACHKRRREKLKKAGIKEKWRSRREKRSVIGRICQFCRAQDHETGFAMATKCEACELRERRHGVCPTHGELRHRGKVCYECTPPLDRIKVLLVEDGPNERQRYVWRAVWSGCCFIWKRWRVIQRWPPEFPLPTDEYIRSRT